LVQDSDQIDDRVGAAQQPAERVLVVDVRADQLDTGEHEQITVPLPPAGRDRDPVTRPDQVVDERTPDESGSAEQTDASRSRLYGHDEVERAPVERDDDRGRIRTARQRISIDKVRRPRSTSRTMDSASATSAAASASSRTSRSLM